MTRVAKRTQRGRKTVLRIVIMLVALACFIPFIVSSMNSAKASDSSSVVTPTDSTTPDGVSQGNGMYLGKSNAATEDQRGAQITLSQYASGGVTESTEKQATDIVLLLDTSSSLGADGLKTLKDSVSSYIDNIAQTVKGTDIDTRFSVIAFSGNTTNNTVSKATNSVVTFDAGKATDSQAVANAQTAVKNIPLGSSTFTGFGMQATFDALNAVKDDGHKKVVVLFTDGVPGIASNSADWYKIGNCSYNSGKSYSGAVVTDCGTGGYRDPVYQANLAIEYADMLKEQMGATVWSLGYFKTEADAIMSNDATSGGIHWSDRTWKGEAPVTKTLTTKVITDSPFGCAPYTYDPILGIAIIGSSPCTHTETTSETVENFNGSVATRRFLEAVSSDGDFTGAAHTDKLMTDATINNWAKSSGQYMMVASDAKDIAKMFTATQKVPNNTPDVVAGTKAIATDCASEYFDVPSDASNIKVYEESAKSVDADGNVTWSGDITPVDVVSSSEDGVHVDLMTGANGNSGIKVSGWDYSSNYVGAHLDGTFGKRLIVRFIETAKSGESGSLATNDTDNSVFTGDDGKELGAYPVPEPVDIVSEYDDSWIPDCDINDVQNNLCLGKDATATTNSSGHQRNADIAMSAYSTGSVVEKTEGTTKPVDAFFLLDFSNTPELGGAQAVDESTYIQKVIDSVAGGAEARLDITTYAGSGSAEGTTKNVLSLSDSEDSTKLGQAKTAFQDTSCPTKGACTGSAAPGGTNAQLGDAMTELATKISADTSGNPKLVVVIGPALGLGKYAWADSSTFAAGCSTGESTIPLYAASPCKASEDPLAQADTAISAAQTMKAAGARVLVYGGGSETDNAAEATGWTSVKRADIIGDYDGGNGTYATDALMVSRQAYELISSNAYGASKLGTFTNYQDSELSEDDLAGKNGAVAWVDTEETYGVHGYYYPSGLNDKEAQNYFVKSISTVVKPIEAEVTDRTDTPNVVDGVTLADYASAYFQTTGKAADVKVYEQLAKSLDASGNPEFSSTPTQIWGTDDGDAATELNVDPKVVVTAVTDATTGTMGYTVSGWNFADNYVGKHKDVKFFGKRLIVRFTESATDKFLGGAGVPTNETGSKHDISGAYATDGFNGNAASSATTLATFPSDKAKVNVDFTTIDFKTQNGKGYEGGVLNLEKLLTDAGGNALTFPALKDGSHNNDFVQVDVSLTASRWDDSSKKWVGDSSQDAALVYSAGKTLNAADYVPSETAKWVGSDNSLIDDSTITMGAVDLQYTATLHLEPAPVFALEPGSIPMGWADTTTEPSNATNADSFSNGKVVGAQLGSATATVYSVLPWVQWNDSQVELKSVNDFTDNLAFNSSSPWRWSRGYGSSNKAADKVPDDGEGLVVSEKVTAVPQFNFVKDHGDEPSKNPGDNVNADNKVTDFAPTVNSDFTVTVQLTGVDSKKVLIAKTANSKTGSEPTGVAQSPSNKALDVADSLENGYPAKTGYDFRVWVVNNFEDPGFPTTCVTSGDMCLGKEVSDVKVGTDGKRTAVVTLTAYLKGDTSGAANSKANKFTKLADFTSAYFGTDGDATKVKVWEQSASKLGDTVEFRRNPVLLSDPSRALTSTPALALYNGDADSAALQVQSTPSDSGNPGFNIQGFDYAVNYVGQRSGSSDLGKRIVMQFTETVDDCFIGGKDVPTNEEQTPGIYTQLTASGHFPGSAFTEIAEFDNPKVDVPAAAACFTVRDGKAYDLGELDLQELLRNADNSAAFSFSKIGSTDQQYNDFASTTFTFTNDTGKAVAHYTIPSATSGMSASFQWLDDSAKIQGAEDVTYTVTSAVTLTGDTASSVSNSDEATVYALAPQLTVQDSATSLGQQVALTNSISGMSWRWVGSATEATATDDGAPANAAVVSEKPTVQKLSYSLVRGTTPSAGTTGGTIGATLTPQKNTDFKAGVTLTTKNSVNGTMVLPSDIDQSLIINTNENTLLTNDEKVATISNNFAQDDGYDFRVWVTGKMQSSLPLTGGMGTGRMFLVLGGMMALAAAAAVTIRKITLMRK
ncbi:MAG: VWA domain-containing protein [Bifidobacteriaceae bacterium]|nr:VWA domain-containing protein [Bifidobacteriaceae bacterium]